MTGAFFQLLLMEARLVMAVEAVATRTDDLTELDRQL
jgi:hypothetical protein